MSDSVFTIAELEHDIIVPVAKKRVSIPSSDSPAQKRQSKSAKLDSESFSLNGNISGCSSSNNKHVNTINSSILDDKENCFEL